MTTLEQLTDAVTDAKAAMVVASKKRSDAAHAFDLASDEYYAASQAYHRAVSALQVETHKASRSAA